LGRDYPWPGNFRELEQCVRNVMIRGEYRPRPAKASGVRESFGMDAAAGTLTLDELTGRYCAIVYSESGSYQEAGRRLEADPRTVKTKMDQEFLEKLQGGKV
jgi:DNA-binding NtrC family response regulator